MNYKKYILISILGVGVSLTTGCNYDKTDPEPATIRRSVDHPSQANFQTQADNAVLCSMTVADIHFVPYHAKLNSLGRARLTAIASYLEQYGGEVIVDFSGRNSELTQQKRIATVRKFLLGQGLDDNALELTSGLTRGQGQDANEATLFYANNLIGGGAAAIAVGAQAQAAPSDGRE